MAVCCSYNLSSSACVSLSTSNQDLVCYTSSSDSKLRYLMCWLAGSFGLFAAQLSQSQWLSHPLQCARAWSAVACRWSVKFLKTIIFHKVVYIAKDSWLIGERVVGPHFIANVLLSNVLQRRNLQKNRSTFGEEVDKIMISCFFCVHLRKLLLLYRPKPIHCNYSLAHYSGFRRISRQFLIDLNQIYRHSSVPKTRLRDFLELLSSSGCRARRRRDFFYQGVPVTV